MLEPFQNKMQKGSIFLFRKWMFMLKKRKFNVLTSENIMNTTFYNESLDKISYKEVEEGDEISMIISFSGIKFGKSNLIDYLYTTSNSN